MNLRQLEVFRAVMQSGGVTRAAGLLHISQPAVSQFIRQLERSFGLPLFVRHGSRLRPTREAEALYAEVQKVFAGVFRVGRVATALREQSFGTISIAAFPALARRLLPAIVARFGETCPEARFKLESMRSRSLIDAVAMQNVDVGFSVLPGDRSEVDSTHLRRLSGVCILPREHRLAAYDAIEARDLEGERFISLGPQDHSRTMVDRVFDAAGVTRDIRVETGQSETTHSFVAEGAGVAVVDPISVYNFRDQRIVVRPFRPLVTFDVYVITPKLAQPLGMFTRFMKNAQVGLQAAFDKLEA